MKKPLAMIGMMGLVATGFVTSANAATLDEMVGTWNWSGFTIAVTKCDATGVCAEVIDGPKNKGMQMIKSKLQAKDDGFVGKIAHPQTGDTYNAKMSLSDANTWHMDGCTPQNVCASGDFVRVQ